MLKAAVSRILALVRRYRLTTFFVLAYALSWWAWILFALGVSPNPIASFGPFLAAIIVLALTEGKAGLLGLFRRMVRWRVAPVWYAVALLLPALLPLLRRASMSFWRSTVCRSTGRLARDLSDVRSATSHSRTRRRLGRAGLEGLCGPSVAAGPFRTRG
jgi:hypothetical protein